MSTIDHEHIGVNAINLVYYHLSIIKSVHVQVVGKEIQLLRFLLYDIPFKVDLFPCKSRKNISTLKLNIWDSTARAAPAARNPAPAARDPAPAARDPAPAARDPAPATRDPAPATPALPGCPRARRSCLRDSRSCRCLPNRPCVPAEAARPPALHPPLHQPAAPRSPALHPPALHPPELHPPPHQPAPARLARVRLRPRPSSPASAPEFACVRARVRPRVGSGQPSNPLGRVRVRISDPFTHPGRESMPKSRHDKSGAEEEFAPLFDYSGVHSAGFHCLSDDDLDDSPVVSNGSRKRKGCKANLCHNGIQLRFDNFHSKGLMADDNAFPSNKIVSSSSGVKLTVNRFSKSVNGCFDESKYSSSYAQAVRNSISIITNDRILESLNNKNTNPISILLVDNAPMNNDVDNLNKGT
ncbi:hypothetical protein IEQ34_003979 [Dendrobium chrysotoxum]|uniref:Uncharacterized protein n=1 Tax=Dendrobium chrysotoxum TaxID=161865 RepID=A0AAV7HCL0_DENCH|nr:hypothetical protein IEQ34_003979 [Dendrobium chrysotoxum]